MDKSQTVVTEFEENINNDTLMPINYNQLMSEANTNTMLTTEIQSLTNNNHEKTDE